LIPRGRKVANKDKEPEVVVVHIKNMNETKNTPAKVKDNPTAQVKHNQPILTGEQDNIEQCEYNELFMSTTKDKNDPKTDFGDIPVPDDEDQQNPCRRLPNTHGRQHPTTGWGA
jgi:hypothetical protein